MEIELPIPSQMVLHSVPLLGWAAGLAFAVLAFSIALRLLDPDPLRRRRRAAAVGWTWVATLMPGCWIFVVELNGFGPLELVPWVASSLGASVLWHLGGAGVGLYVSDLLMATTVPRRRRSPPTPTPAASPVPSPPVIRPPPGAPVASADGGEPSGADTLGLLNALREGPDFQRPAAARALSLSFAGTADREVARALLDLLGTAEASVAGRTEAYIALHQVFGDELDLEVEVQLRREFPEGTDPERVLAWEVRLDSVSS